MDKLVHSACFAPASSLYLSIAFSSRFGYALLASEGGGKEHTMEEKKNLCAPIPLSLHQRLRAEQEQRGQTLADYITDILNEHFEGGAKNMGNTNRTIAFQVPEELFDRLKDYLAKHGLKQKNFILGLIERELNDAVDAE